MDVYERARLETKNLEKWIQLRESRIVLFTPEELPEHPAVRLATIMHGVTVGIRKGNQEAINLGCELIEENQKYCFGVSIKSSILFALKNNVDKISKFHKEELSKLTAFLLNLDFPPREIKWYCKLVRKFECNYVTAITSHISSNRSEAIRWINYLNKKP